MKSHLIHRTRNYELVSYGNGLAYMLAKLGVEHKSILFQGDDADQFRKEYEMLTNGRIQLSTNDVLGVLWNDYEHVAEVTEPQTKSAIIKEAASRLGYQVLDLKLSQVAA